MRKRWTDTIYLMFGLPTKVLFHLSCELYHIMNEPKLVMCDHISIIIWKCNICLMKLTRH